MAKPSIDRDKCKKCGKCVSACQMGVLEWDETDGPQITNPLDCAGCMVCELGCPGRAITVME